MNRFGILTLALLCSLAAGHLALAGDAEEQSPPPEVSDAHRAAFANVRTVRLVLEEDYEKHGETFDVRVREGITDLLGLFGLSVAENGDADAELVITVSARPFGAQYSLVGLPGRQTHWTGGEATARASLRMTGLPPIETSAYEEVRSNPISLGPVPLPSGRVADSPAWRLASQCCYSSVIDILMRFDRGTASAVVEQGTLLDLRALFPVLARWKDQPAVAMLVEMFHDATMNVPQEAILALVQIGPPAVPALVDALSDADADVRRWAAVALGAIGAPAETAVPALIEALRDSDWQVRQQAAVGLGGIGASAKAAVPALIEALTNNRWVVREAAAEALGRIGPQAETAISALEERAEEDESAGVRATARQALAQIRGEE